MIDQYKTSKKSYIINFVPNQFYCLAGYWIEAVNPGTFQSVFYKKSKQRINQYKNTKKDVDEFFKDINSEYKSIKKEIKDIFWKNEFVIYYIYFSLRRLKKIII